MKAKDIVAQEVARQAKFGMRPSWEDFVIAGQEAGVKEVVKELRLRGDMSMNFPFSNIRKEAWQDVLKELGIVG